MSTLVLGSGFIADHLPYERITDRIQLHWYETKDLLSRHRPSVLINCLGKTGRPNVDWCSSHKEETAEANVSIPIMLAEICRKLDIHLIHFGSGCIYFGESPHAGNVHTPEKIRPDSEDYKKDEWTWTEPGWKETDFANPKSFYSKTKYACDLAIGELPNVTTLRLRMPISEKDTSRNLINKLRGYTDIIDIPNSVTFLSDLTRCVQWAVDKRPTGIFHIANPEPLTAARIMREYQKYVPGHQFNIIDEKQLDAITVAKRSNCILDTSKLRQAGFQMTNTDEALEQCMKNYMDKQHV